MNQKIEVEKQQLKELYKALTEVSNPSRDKIESEMKKCFGEDVFKFSSIERIKTFEDACRELGKEHPLVCEWRLGENLSSDLEAFLKLRIVVAALNEGWEPQFTEGERRYYPWVFLYTQNEIKDMDMDERKERNLHISKIGDYAGFAFANSASAPSSAHAHIGSRLCLKNSELATYCGKQFITLWKDFGFK